MMSEVTYTISVYNVRIKRRPSIFHHYKCICSRAKPTKCATMRHRRAAFHSFFFAHDKRTSCPLWCRVLSSNCKIPSGSCFINTRHSSSTLPTEDYQEPLGMPAPGPKTGEGLLPWPNKGNNGISQIRHLHTRHQGEVGAQSQAGCCWKSGWRGGERYSSDG